jgi:N-acyl-D-aspartate/D-glutamate deacylase
MNYNVWDGIPVFRQLSGATTLADKMTLVQDENYRARFRREYNPDRMAEAGGRLEVYWLINACGSATYEPFEGKMLRDVASALGKPITDIFLDILVDTKMGVLFRSDDSGARNIENMAEILAHPRVLPGVSDGGAHSKHGNGGFWSTDMILWLTRETGRYTLEEVHELLARNSRAFGLEGRGVIAAGAHADLLIYDTERLNFTPADKYEVLNDLPGGDWRKVKRAVGIRHIVVNGSVTFNDNVCTNATPGEIISNTERLPLRAAVAAE